MSTTLGLMRFYTLCFKEEAVSRFERICTGYRCGGGEEGSEASLGEVPSLWGRSADLL